MFPVSVVNAVCSVPSSLLQIDKDHDPMAQYKRPTIADREDDYRARRRAQVLSPDRIDPFMDGK